MPKGLVVPNQGELKTCHSRLSDMYSQLRQEQAISFPEKSSPNYRFKKVSQNKVQSQDLRVNRACEMQ